MSGGELLQGQPSKQARENTYVEEEVGSEATQRVPSSEMPPPGTIMWTCGWGVSAEPQVWRMERTPMRGPRGFGAAAVYDILFKASAQTQITHAAGPQDPWAPPPCPSSPPTPGSG